MQSHHRRAVAKKGGKLKKNAGGSATIDLTDALTSMTGVADTMKEQNERTQQWLESEAAKQEARDKELADFRARQLAQGDSQNKLMEALIKIMSVSCEHGAHLIPLRIWDAQLSYSLHSNACTACP